MGRGNLTAGEMNLTAGAKLLPKNVVWNRLYALKRPLAEAWVKGTIALGQRNDCFGLKERLVWVKGTIGFGQRNDWFGVKEGLVSGKAIGGEGAGVEDRCRSMGRGAKPCIW